MKYTWTQQPFLARVKQQDAYCRTYPRDSPLIGLCKPPVHKRDISSETEIEIPPECNTSKPTVTQNEPSKVKNKKAQFKIIMPTYVGEQTNCVFSHAQQANITPPKTLGPHPALKRLSTIKFAQRKHKALSITLVYNFIKSQIIVPTISTPGNTKPTL